MNKKKKLDLVLIIYIAISLMCLYGLLYPLHWVIGNYTLYDLFYDSIIVGIFAIATTGFVIFVKHNK